MRFTIVPIALLALVPSLAPGVHGAPAAPPAVPAVLCSVVHLIASLGTPVTGLLEQLGLDPTDCPASGAPLLGLGLRAVTPPALSLSSATPFSTTRTNASLPTPSVSNTSGVSSRASAVPVPLSRMRRQLPIPTPSLPINPSAVVPSALSAILASVPAGLPSKVESATNKSKPTASPSQA